MRPRSLPIPAMLMAATTLLLAFGGVLLNVANHNSINASGIAVATFLAFPAMGLLILWHRPNDLIGYLLLAIGVNIYFTFVADDYARYSVVRHPGVLPFGPLVAWMSAWNWIPFALMVVVLLPLLFPSGRLLSRRWWLVVAIGLVFGALAFAGNALVPGPPNSSYPDVVNPLGIKGYQPLFTTLQNASLPFLLAAIIGAVSSVIVRYRRGHLTLRRQLRWFLFAVVVATIPFITYGQVPDVISQLTVAVAIPLIPVAIAVAMLRYRLYDIDVVINKSLVYGALAVFISAVYVGIVVGIGSLIGAGRKPNLALSILATAIVAVAFQPVRERLRKLASRLVYGLRATPYEVVTDFANRMSGTLSVDEVLPKMAEAAAAGVGACAARVTLFLPEGEPRLASWPTSLTTALPDPTANFSRSVPISHRGLRIGELAITKKPGEPIIPAEAKLLADLASQAGLVLHNVRLALELQARLAEISGRAAELRASRQRLVSAQDAERQRLERTIHDGPERELVAIASQLNEVPEILARDSNHAVRTLEQLMDRANATLENLRDIARGVYPPLLRDHGLKAALEAQLKKTAGAITLDLDGVTRYPSEVEAAVYFCCLEGIQHAIGPALIRIQSDDRQLQFSISGARLYDGVFQRLEDRIEALGGRLRATSDTLVGSLPVDQFFLAASQAASSRSGSNFDFEM